MSKQTKVLIVDDIARARQSLRALLATCPQVGAICEAAGGHEALAISETWQPAVIVTDIRMPDMDGLEVTRIVKNRWPWIKVIALSLYGDYKAAAQGAGADAFVMKGEPAECLLSVLAAQIEAE